MNVSEETKHTLFLSEFLLHRPTELDVFFWWSQNRHFFSQNEYRPKRVGYFAHSPRHSVFSFTNVRLASKV